MWFKNGAKTGHHIVISGILLQPIELISKRFYQTDGRYYQVNFRLFPDAARYELSKVISAHDNHHWLSISYKGDLSQLWQNRAFCDKFCDKTVAQNCIRCDKVINISGWKKKTALLQSSEMCHDKVIFSSLKTRLFYLETFQFHLLFPALISQHFAIYF